MITKTKQTWAVGATVKVGFLTLLVQRAIQTPGDYKPDAYLLSNLAGSQLYKFVPHHGLEKITMDEYNELLLSDIALIKAQAAKAIAKASSTRAIDALFACEVVL